MDKQAGDQLDHRQDLHLKYYFFYQIVVFLETACSAVQRFGEEKPRGDTWDQPLDVGGVRHRWRTLESDRTEDEPVDQDGDDGLDEHPDNAKIGADKTFSEICFGKFPDQLSFCHQLLQ